MHENKKPLELLELLNLDPGPVIEGRLLRWAQAFESWIAERRARFGPDVAPASLNAWREFLAFCGKPPWEATTADVEGYVGALTKRKLQPGTISHRLARLANFYQYCQAHAVDPQCEAGFNPVAAVSRPEPPPLEKARYLTLSEEASLLAAIRRDPSLLGKRDYALFLLLLRTGWKAGDVRQLKWGDLSWGAGERQRRALLGSGGAGTGDRGRLPGEVLAAIREYLEASGRLAGMLPDDYIFVPSHEALLHQSGNRAEDWDSRRPLSKSQLRKLLKQHAERAGLKAARINCHTLRHTSAMRQVEAGASLEAVGATLRMQQAVHIKNYLNHLSIKPKGRLRARKRLDPATGELVPPGSEEIPSRGPRRAQRKNHLALRHGFYAKYLPEFEWLAEDGREPQGMDRAIMRWRIVMRRILIVGDGVDNLEDAMRYLKLTGLAAHRLCRALKVQQEMRDLQMQLRWAAFFEARRR
jgi:integrase